MSRILAELPRRISQGGPALVVAGLAVAALAGLSWMRGQPELLAVAVVFAACLPFLRGEIHPPPSDSAPTPRTGGPDGVAAAAPGPLVLLDRRAAILQANGPAQAAFPRLKVGQPIAFVLRAPEILDAVSEALADGREADVEWVGRRAGGPAYAVSVRRITAGETGPDDPALALFFRDLTAEKRLETMRADFVAHVSHELRTPLATLSGFIDTLAGPARDDAAARSRFLQIMRGQADRMRRLIDDLLQLSRVEMRTHLPPTEPIRLAEAAAQMVETMAPLAAERGVAIVTSLDPEARIAGARDEILRVIENLLANAVTYGGSGGQVDVEVARDPEAGTVGLTVRDRGAGIAAHHLPRLTERFYRVDVEESRAQGGTGLGLAIVKHVAARHRARLQIESEPGSGTLVRLTFPAAAPASPAGRHEPVM